MAARNGSQCPRETKVKPQGPESVTALLQAWNAGSEEAGRRLVPLVYGELRRRAAGYLRGERHGHTLQPYKPGLPQPGWAGCRQ